MDDQEKGGDQDEGPTVASEVPFSELCGLLEKISKTQGNDKKKRILKDFIDKWREYHDKLHKGKKDLVCRYQLVCFQFSYLYLLRFFVVSAPFKIFCFPHSTFLSLYERVPTLRERLVRWKFYASELPITFVQINNTYKKKRILKDFIDKWREYHDKLHKGKKDLVCSVIETEWAIHR
jgi:alpha-L-arabinofuranosidase